MRKFWGFVKNQYVLFVGGLVIGALIVLGIRLATYKVEAGVHYHANFAVYINGQREQFKALNYYEEEAAASCGAAAAAEAENSPMARVHLHDNVNDVVHVEDNLVTWGNLFNVLGWGITENYLATRDSVYTPSDDSSLTYMLNGKKVADVSNTIIDDQDKLLINFGSQSPDQLQQEYDLIKNNARQADGSKDPAGCGGSAHFMPTFRDRMNHMF